jgi:hypothetical protein
MLKVQLMSSSILLSLCFGMDQKFGDTLTHSQKKNCQKRDLHWIQFSVNVHSPYNNHLTCLTCVASLLLKWTKVLCHQHTLSYEQDLS